MKNNKIICHYIASIISIFCFTNAYSKQIIYENLIELVSNSDIILIGTVEDTVVRLFEQNQVDIRVENSIAGDIISGNISAKFGRENIFIAKEEYKEFVCGKQYVFFLVKNKNDYNLLKAEAIQNNDLTEIFDTLIDKAEIINLIRKIKK